MSNSEGIAGKIREAVDKGDFIIIEREIGAENGLAFAKEALSDYDVYETTASIKNDNVFSNAMPKHSDMLRIGTPPKVMIVYLSDMNGMLLAEAHREESSMDADIFSGMLNAVSNFVKDSIQQWSGEEEKESGGLDALSYRDDTLGNLTIRIKRGKLSVLIVTYKGDISREIEVDLDKTVKWIDEHHLAELEGWSGNTNEPFLNDITEDLNRTFLESGKYDGKLDMDGIMENKEHIKDYLYDAINENINKGKKPVYLFDDLENIDPLSLDLIKHVLSETQARVICQYITEVLEDTKIDENINELIRELENKNRCTHISLRSDIDIEELVLSKFSDVDSDTLKLLSYAATIEVF